MNNDTDDIFDFPCRFPIKAMGRDAEGFPAHVMELVATSAGPVDHDAVDIRPSRDGKYISVTVTFTATSRKQLDEIYTRLTSSQRILVVL